MLKTGSTFPFIIMNTNQSNKKGTHWWSFLDLHPKKEIFLSDSFDFKEIILQDDRNIINKILCALKRLMKRTIK